MPLTDTTIKNAKPSAKPQRLFDGGGLYLEIAPAGGRWWRLKYRFGGKEKRLSLGTYPETSLKLARERRDAARKQLAEGVDPGEERKADKARALRASERSFESVARVWLSHLQKANAQTKTRIWRSLEVDVLPVLGAKPIDAITREEVVDLARGIQERGVHETAVRVLRRVQSVFRFSMDNTRKLGFALSSDPTSGIRPGEKLGERPRVRHRAALPEAELQGFLAKLDAYAGDFTTAQALRLLLLTAVRPGELRGARWAEFDLTAATWRIPAERMKMRQEHLVPLSRQAVEVLQAMEPISGGGVLVFPSAFYPGKPLSENTLNSALARMGYKGIATAHGMRALFSTVANECGHDPDVIERQLAHVERNAVRAAYHRAAYVAERAALVQWWADWLDGKRMGKVIPIGRRKV